MFVSGVVRHPMPYLRHDHRLGLFNAWRFVSRISGQQRRHVTGIYGHGRGTVADDFGPERPLADLQAPRQSRGIFIDGDFGDNTHPMGNSSPKQLNPNIFQLREAVRWIVPLFDLRF